MYTEDDEEVNVKNKNSSGYEGDFYTSFNNMEEDNKKSKKKKNEKENVPVPQNEDYYSDFYDSGEETTVEDNSRKTKNIIKIIVIILLLAVLIILLVILLGNKSSGDIELASDNYTLKDGETEYISYKIVGTESNVNTTFTSSNPNVVTVNENGQIKAVGNGTATITIKYTIDGKTKEKKCTVKVDGPAKTYDITLNLTANTTNWTNKDVTITVDAKSDANITSLKYALNCSSNCQYTDVTNNKIVISNSGTTKVTVVAKNSSNKEATKEITVKIDKEAPEVNLSKTNIVSNSDTSVCVTCTDSLSGCKEAKVCQKYTSSKSNQVITVYDNAGNSKSSKAFNVTINKLVSPCTLKVSSDGKVTATLNGTFTYYGFDSKYTGSNTLSKTISISASKKGESGAKIVNYYVKNSNNSTGSCSITVIKECKCKDAKSTATNCAVTCTFRAG